MISSIYLEICSKKFEKIYERFYASEVVGTVISNNKETEYKNTYKVRIENLNILKDINFILRVPKSKKASINYGDIIKVKGKYLVPEEAKIMEDLIIKNI